MRDATQTTDRRRFTRIAFDAKTELKLAEQSWPVELVDISFNGVLVARPSGFEPHLEHDYTVNVQLLDGELTICLPVTLVRTGDDLLGFRCNSIDIDSMSHLRRLVELNLGSVELLDRELEHLVNAE